MKVVKWRMLGVTCRKRRWLGRGWRCVRGVGGGDEGCAVKTAGEAAAAAAATVVVME